mmetsp:Transcript_57336/g.153576  ORF Transcript_57336/g.153576 Transcript_57336/m.153576 type:complete len:220 (+) Transcript_57336:119-778(+)
MNRDPRMLGEDFVHKLGSARCEAARHALEELAELLRGLRRAGLQRRPHAQARPPPELVAAGLAGTAVVRLRDRQVQFRCPPHQERAGAMKIGLHRPLQGQRRQRRGVDRDYEAAAARPGHAHGLGADPQEPHKVPVARRRLLQVTLKPVVVLTPGVVLPSRGRGAVPGLHRVRGHRGLAPGQALPSSTVVAALPQVLPAAPLYRQELSCLLAAVRPGLR